jgi:predicted glycosyltransferase
MSKNYLFDLNHPAHVHLFRNLIKILQQKKHNVVITAKNIASIGNLLKLYGLPFRVLGEKKDNIGGKFKKQFSYNMKMLKIVREENISIGLGSSVTVAHVSRFTRMKSFIFDDDDKAVQPLFTWLAMPFADHIFSPDCLAHERVDRRYFNYPGYHELAYLHPNRFQPDPTILKEAGLEVGEPYFILRFNAFQAHHDIRASGLNIHAKRKLIEILKIHGRIFITTEKEIDKEFEQFRFPVSPEKMHHFMSFATMLIGDSQTMTSEAVVLGVPAIRCNTFVGKISYLIEEEEKYDMTYGFLPNQVDAMLLKIKVLLNKPDLKTIWQKKRETLLADKIDVTALWLWMIENYPESMKADKNNPQFFDQFK